MIMSVFFNFKMPKPKQFEYRPRFYDERKERLEKMKARAEAELAAEKDGTRYTGLQKGFLAENRANSKLKRTPLKEKSALRFIIILIAILGIFYFLAPDVFLAFWKIK